MNVVQLIFIFCLCSNSVTGQACDSSSNHTQCSDGEVCAIDVCETAIDCYKGSSINTCQGHPGFNCRSDYCQPYSCDFTGQCVHGQVCAQRLICAYPILYNVDEGSDVVLKFAEQNPGNYEKIQWWKGTEELDFAAFGPPLVGPQPMYYGNLCPGGLSCVQSDRAELDTATGDLTIRNVTLRDEDFYYYSDYEDYIYNNGDKYEYYIHVNVDPEMTIQGIPEGLIKVGTNLMLTCTVQKVNPETTDLCWVISGNNHTGSVETGPDGTFSKNSIYMHRVTKEDEGNTITCVVVRRLGHTITVEKTVNLGYAPAGKPVIQVSTMGQYNGEQVSLTCENPPSIGKPVCDLYTWRRLEGNINYLPDTKVYTFIMDELYAGNYSCQCSNEFGQSEISDEVEILYLGERPKAQEDDYEKPANNRSTVHQYAYINEGAMGRPSSGVVNQEDGYEQPAKNQRSVNRSQRAPSNVSLYDYIDDGTMARPVDGGYINRSSTYEDIL